MPDGQAEILVFDGNFHGRPTTIVGFSSEAKYQAGFGPFTPGFRRVRYGDIEAVKAAIQANTVAVLFEPIQGEAGVVIPPSQRGIMDGSFDYALVVAFDDSAGHAAYQEHADHEVFRQQTKGFWQDIKTNDAITQDFSQR